MRIVVIVICLDIIQSGRLATGVLTPLVKTAGFTNVSEFLQKGTDDVAKCLQWQSPVTVTA